MLFHAPEKIKAASCSLDKKKKKKIQGTGDVSQAAVVFIICALFWGALRDGKDSVTLTAATGRF